MRSRISWERSVLKLKLWAILDMAELLETAYFVSNEEDRDIHWNKLYPLVGWGPISTKYWSILGGAVPSTKHVLPTCSLPLRREVSQSDESTAKMAMKHASGEIHAGLKDLSTPPPKRTDTFHLILKLLNKHIQR